MKYDILDINSKTYSLLTSINSFKNYDEEKDINWYNGLVSLYGEIHSHALNLFNIWEFEIFKDEDFTQESLAPSSMYFIEKDIVNFLMDILPSLTSLLEGLKIEKKDFKPFDLDHFLYVQTQLKETLTEYLKILNSSRDKEIEKSKQSEKPIDAKKPSSKKSSSNKNRSRTSR